MAKFIMSYENDIEKRELSFRSKTYDFSMLPNGPRHKKGDKPGFDTQVKKAHPELADEDELLELLDQLSFESGSGILDILEQLQDWEDVD